MATRSSRSTAKSVNVQEETVNPVTEENVSETIATEEMPETVEVSENVEETKEESTEPVNRIPELLASQFILNDLCQKYLGVVDKTAAYNQTVIGEKDSEWTSAKVVNKARELANPTDANVEANKEIKDALDAWENLVTEQLKARKVIVDLASKALGISLSSVAAERDMELEAKLKEERKLATVIGDQLKLMGTLTTDANTTEVVNAFLNAYPLPMVGRDQVHNFGADNAGKTPKYRVNIVVTRDGETILSEEGFTKLALALPPYYERGKAPKAPMFREVWEKAGNSPEKTVQPTVQFEDNGLVYTITKK